MDSNHFDNVVKLLGRASPRRGALAVAALVGLRLADLEGADARKKTKKRCRKGCIAPQSKCTTKCHKCCPDSQGNPRFCELVPVCPESADGKYCCGKEGTECGQDCDCCGDLVCPSGACCVSFGVACSASTVCCGACEGGTCCSSQGGECETADDCCGGLACAGAVPGVTLGACTQN